MSQLVFESYIPSKERVDILPFWNGKSSTQNLFSKENGTVPRVKSFREKINEFSPNGYYEFLSHQTCLPSCWGVIIPKFSLHVFIYVYFYIHNKSNFCAKRYLGPSISCAPSFQCFRPLKSLSSQGTGMRLRKGPMWRTNLGWLGGEDEETTSSDEWEGEGSPTWGTLSLGGSIDHHATINLLGSPTLRSPWLSTIYYCNQK